MVRHIGISPQHQVAGLGHPTDFAAASQQEREIVPRIAIEHQTVPDIQDAVEGCNEHIIYTLTAKNGVGTRHAFRRRLLRQGNCADDSPADSHEDSGRDTFPRDIGNYKPQAAVVDREEVVEISADVLRRVHVGINLQCV